MTRMCFKLVLFEYPLAGKFWASGIWVPALQIRVFDCDYFIGFYSGSWEPQLFFCFLCKLYPNVLLSFVHAFWRYFFFFCLFILRLFPYSSVVLRCQAAHFPGHQFCMSSCYSACEAIQWILHFTYQFLFQSFLYELFSFLLSCSLVSC